MLAFSFDILLIGLCVAVLIYLLRVKSAIGIIQKSRIELKKMIADFSHEITRAETALQALKTNGTKSLELLETGSKKAVNLHDDLEFLIHRGTDIADRLEAISYESRKKIDDSRAKATQRKSQKDSLPKADKVLEDLGGLR